MQGKNEKEARKKNHPARSKRSVARIDVLAEEQLGVSCLFWCGASVGGVLET